MLASLPNQFNEATTKTIENIDVLWLSGQPIVAAFEVEHTCAAGWQHLQLTEWERFSRTGYRSRQELTEGRVVLDELIDQVVVLFDWPYRDQAPVRQLDDKSLAPIVAPAENSFRISLEVTQGDHLCVHRTPRLR
jgi:hypothetical protein